MFVSLASYRDHWCQQTVRQLFVQATCPQNLFVSVFDQLDPEDESCVANLMLDRRVDLNRVWYQRILAKDARGSADARYVAADRVVREYERRFGRLDASVATNLDGERPEPMFMQVDSHMFYAQNWDRALYLEYFRASIAQGQPQVVLSYMPPAWIPRWNERTPLGRKQYIMASVKDGKPKLMPADTEAARSGSVCDVEIPVIGSVPMTRRPVANSSRLAYVMASPSDFCWSIGDEWRITGGTIDFNSYHALEAGTCHKVFKRKPHGRTFALPQPETTMPDATEQMQDEQPTHVFVPHCMQYRRTGEQFETAFGSAAPHPSLCYCFFVAPLRVLYDVPFESDLPYVWW